MTTCNPTKIRSLIEKHLGKDKLQEYDTVVEQCKLGNALKNDRVWAPLCPKYPNLKGVTCEEIKTHIDNSPTPIADEDYFHHVRVYDRDEEYEAFKKIGKQIEADNPGLLLHPTTIFVTTPRGGHEMLSIFAYANDIDKAQIPSNITWKHVIGGKSAREPDYKKDPFKARELDPEKGFYTETYGKDWLGGYSDTVKNVFIVDDIIASGEQIETSQNRIEMEFPDAKVYSVTLCKREDVPEKGRPLNSRDDTGEMSECDVEIEKYYNDTKTIGIKQLKKLRETGKLEGEYVTCLFPHACPDGTSDEPMIELMGGKRCPPEKRIARRDL